LTSNRCPECGRDFDPANPRTFLARPRRVVLRRIIKLLLILFCLTLPADAYFGYLDWQVRRERRAIQFLLDHDARVTTYDTRPNWVKALLNDHAAWLWQRADSVYIDGVHYRVKNVPKFMATVGNLKSLRSLDLMEVPVTDGDLVNLMDMTALRQLSLWSRSVTDAGLAKLKGLVALQKLELIGVHVTDTGLANLKGLTALRELSVYSASVTDAGLVNLKRLTSLQQLYLADASVTGSGLTILQGNGLTALSGP
jgi:hypothetical protein